MSILQVWVGESDEDIVAGIKERSRNGESVSMILKELIRSGMEKDRLRRIEQKLDSVLERLDGEKT